MTSTRTIALVAIGTLALGVSVDAAGPESVPASFRNLDGAALDVERAAVVRGVEVDLGGARLVLDEATVMPVAVEAADPFELTVIGRARLIVEPDDPIDAGQLELFSGGRSLDVPVTSAVLVLGNEEAARRLLTGEPDPAVPDEATRRAGEVFDAWRASAERRYLDVGTASHAIAVGDPGYRGYAVAWVETEDHGTLTLRHDPGEYHPVLLGRFTPWEIGDQLAYLVDREIDRSDKRGESLAFRLVDLGDWDVWVEGPRPTPEGPRSGSSGFEPVHMKIAVDLETRDPDFEARAEIECVAEQSGRRVLPFDLTMALDVVEVTDPDGHPLPWSRDGGRTLVLLPAPTVAGEPVRIVVHYRGDLLYETRPGSFLSRSTIAWTPRIGTVGRASYDLRFSWPSGLDLVCSGTPVEDGKDDGREFVRAVVDVPVLGVSFELGKFDFFTDTLGPTTIVLALPSTGSRIAPADDIRAVVKLALAYQQRWFGAYPLERLTVAFVPRSSSQGALSFVTMSEGLLREPGSGLYVTGRRALPRELLRTDLFATLAHEIAHQWWGNRVGWRSGRDQWLSEALAEFVEERFLRDVLEIDARDLAERAEWAKRGYESATGLDRPPHAYGPPVLGVRLDSTLSADAYRGVVYDKGSTVFTMVADRLGEEPFVEMLGALAEAVDHRTIDTPTFFRAIEKMSGIDLDPIVLPFVYDINFPRVLYSHRVETNEDGAWLVRGVLEQFPSFHRKSRVTRRGEGAWDVVNEYRIHGAPRGVSIGVPFEVAYGSSQRSNELVRGVGGTILMRPGATPFAVRLDEEPTGFWLDQRGRTFARYLCGTCDARLATIARIDALIALDRRAEAVALVRAAIEDGHGDRVKQTRRFERSPFGVALHTRMAMLLLDDDEDAAALRELETAEEGYRKREPGVIEMGGGVERRWLQVVEFHRGVFGEASLKRGLLALRARIDLRAGRTDAAWDRLSRWLYLDIPQREGESTGDSYARNSMSTNSIDGDGQAYALLAIAACTSGRTSACLAATREARRREADLSALQVPATP